MSSSPVSADTAPSAAPPSDHRRRRPGPSRARQWINDFGDPRVNVDPVEWIESIPFAETRNYVQRVLENTIVYRHRLTGQPVEIKLSDDLRRGRPR